MATGRSEQSGNITYLFESHKNKSEQWWTALFSILLVQLGRAGPIEFRTHRYKSDGVEWKIEPYSKLCFQKISLSNVHMEAYLSAVFKELDETNYGYVPDLIVVEPELRKIAIIENKTKGASFGQSEGYIRAAERLRQLGYSAEAFLLISACHPDEAIWRAILRVGFPLILWEDAIRFLSSVQCLREMFDDLQPFCEPPILEGRHS